MHLNDELFLLFLTKLDIVESSTLILGFTELSIFNYNIFALGRSPCLVVKLTLLSRLALHELSDVLFTCVALNVHIQVGLLVDEATTTFLTFDALLVRYSFLGAMFETSGGKGEVTFLGGNLLVKGLGQSHLTTLAHTDGSRLPRVAT